MVNLRRIGWTRFIESLLEGYSGDKIKLQSIPGYCVDYSGVKQVISDFHTTTSNH